MNTCPTCGNQAPGTDAVLCPACVYQLRAWLRELPLHLPLLAASLQPDTGPAQRSGSGRAHAPLPLRLDVLDLIGPGHPVPLDDPHGDQSAGIPMTALLYGWARYIAAEHPAVRRDQHGTQHSAPCDGAWARQGTGVPGLCAWLTAYLPYAATREWVDELHQQIGELVERVRRITHTTPRRHSKQAPCPVPDCQAFALTGTEDQLHITCQACGGRLTPEEYEAHRAQVMPALAAIAVRLAAARSVA